MDWEEGMSVGVESIDVHHRQVWRRIRHLANAVSDGRDDEVLGALRFLHGYLAERQAEEESWMTDAGYPGAREHGRIHADLLNAIEFARTAEPPLGAKALLGAAEQVVEALERHMREDDLRLGRFFTARENLRRLAEAEPGVGASLTPLPGSLAPAPTPAPERREPGPSAPRPPASSPDPRRH